MCHVKSELTNQRRVFKACLTQSKFFDDVTRKIGPLDFTDLNLHKSFQFRYSEVLALVLATNVEG